MWEAVTETNSIENVYCILSAFVSARNRLKNLFVTAIGHGIVPLNLSIIPCGAICKTKLIVFNDAYGVNSVLCDVSKYTGKP